VPLVQPAHHVAEHGLALRLVEELVQETVVLLVLLVLGSGVLEEIAARAGSAMGRPRRRGAGTA